LSLRLGSAEAFAPNPNRLRTRSYAGERTRHEPLRDPGLGELGLAEPPSAAKRLEAMRLQGPMGPHLTEMQLSERDATPAGSRRNGHRNLRFRSVLGRRPPFGWRHFVPCGEISSFLVGGLTGMERATAAGRWGVGRNTYKSGSILPTSNVLIGKRRDEAQLQLQSGRMRRNLE
jgi:hypothetical protein